MGRTHRYGMKLRWTGAAAGPTKTYAGYSREYVVAIDGKADLRGSADPAFRGDKTLHNPEEMLVAALSSCHMLTYLALAVRAGIEVVAYEDEATGVMTEEGAGGKFTEVVLRPTVTIAAGADGERAAALHEEAHRDCYVARSVSFPVKHDARIVTAPPESA